jgi:hypothetical protein
MSDHEPITNTLDPPFEPDEDELPRRPRRRTITPVTIALAAVLIAAVGFIGGVQVQKHSQPATPAAAGLGGTRQGAGGQGGGFAQGGGNATVGRVANVKGSTIYVTGADGTTIRVKTNANSKVTRTAKSRPSAIHPGDTVIVEGTTSDSGTVTASQIVATASNATAGRGAFGGTSTTPGDPTP